MTIWESILLGVLQGLTEFLPISSSGHLFLAQKLFSLDADLAFDCFLHCGTLLAVILVYFKKIVQLVKKPRKDNLLRNLLIASACTFVVALPIKLFTEENFFYTLLPFGFALSIAAILLSEFIKKKKYALKLKRAPLYVVALCGFVQGFALLPGLSRSGSTISTLRCFSVTYEESAEFSFLLSVPIIVASAAVEALELLVLQQSTVSVLCIVAGSVTSFIVGLAVIKLFLNSLKKGNLLYYAFYLCVPLLLSVLIL